MSAGPRAVQDVDAGREERQGEPAAAPVRLGFVGLGWIGAMRLDAVAAAGAGVPAALCDPVPERVEKAAASLPEAARFAAPEDLLRAAADLNLDGIVIATPNALHAPQAVRAILVAEAIDALYAGSGGP